LAELDGPAADYLTARGIPEDVASEGYTVTHWGRLWLAFRLVGPDRKMVGLSLRTIGEGEPKKRVIKADPEAPAGVYASPGAFKAPVVIVVEAPIDALSLLAAGSGPVIATIGTNLPSWLAERLALKRVMLAYDADEAGDKATLEAAAKLREFGVHPLRMRPPAPWKDWNDVLQAVGTERLAKMLPEM